MIFDEIDKLINDSLNSRYKNRCVERRDYYKLEEKWIREDPSLHSKGYGDRNGIMYLVDVDGFHYIDVRILKENIRLTFRMDESKFMDKSFTYEKFSKDYLSFFFYSIDNYFESDSLFDKFNMGKIPLNVIRENKLNEIL